MNRLYNISLAVLLAFAAVLNAAAQSTGDDDYEVVRDTINYTTRPQLDTSDPMRYVTNNPATPPKGSGGLSHINMSSKADTVSTADSTTTATTQKQPEQPKQPQHVTHVVRSGETLGKIASKYHVSVKQIVKLNGLPSADRISIGQKLKIK